ncbi:hypothetical protein D3C73_925500 [compost metagenome]
MKSTFERQRPFCQPSPATCVYDGVRKRSAYSLDLVSRLMFGSPCSACGIALTFWMVVRPTLAA